MYRKIRHAECLIGKLTCFEHGYTERPLWPEPIEFS